MNIDRDEPTEPAESDDERTCGLLLDRRDYLKATGALAAPVASGQAMGSVDDAPPATMGVGGVAPTALRVEYEADPVNVRPDRTPRFSWTVPANARGTAQSAYRILVASSSSNLANENGDVWDSGKVASAQSTAVDYGGVSLAADTTYYWKVRVWDGSDTASDWSAESTFTTALPDDDAQWGGEWIGYEPGSTSAWSDYTLEADFTIVNDAAGIVFRAQDANNCYMWQVLTSASPDNPNGYPVLRPHVRQGGGWTDLGDVDISGVLGGSENAQHTIAIETSGSTITTRIDGTQVDQRSDSTFAAGDVGFRQHDDEHARFDDVSVVDATGATLFADDFSHSSVQHFGGGSISNGQLDLLGGGVTLRSAPAWDDYTVETDFTIHTDAAGVLLRVQDADNLYMWQVNVAGSTPLLRPHVKSGGSWTVLAEVDISGVLGGSENAQHHLTVQASGSTITTWIDGTQVDQRSDSTFAAGDVGFREDGSEHAGFDDLVVTDAHGATLFADDFSHASVAHFDGGTIVNGQLDCNGTGVVQRGLGASSDSSSPLLRTEAGLANKTIASARAHVATLGYGELYVNGYRIGDDELNPGWTNYAERVLYSTYDVTGELTQGATNAVGLWLGRGWFSKSKGSWSSMGDPRAIVQLNVEYADGTGDTIVTDAGWTADPSPITANDIYDGESYDARLEQSGWATVGFDDSGWASATAKSAPSADFAWQPQRTPAIQHTESFSPQSVSQANGGWMVDFGQNVVGWVELSISGANAGDQVTIEHAETLVDGGVMSHTSGTLNQTDLRAADATDTYVCSGASTETYEPRFTYHGFRHVKVTGYPGTLSASDITAKAVHTANDVAGESTFSCANGDLNAVQHAAKWSLLNNAHSVPTDCPQRDERHGWTGDAHMVGMSRLYNFDAFRFLEKWMRDHDDNIADGTQTDTIPHGNGSREGDPNWTKTQVTIPWYMYRHTGDRRVLEDRYDDMKAYADHWHGNASNGIIPSAYFQYGDWLAPGGGSNQELLNTFAYYQVTEIMAQVASELGRTSDASTFSTRAANIRSAFNSNFYDAANATYASGKQTELALPLFAGIVPDGDEAAVTNTLVAQINADGGALSTGFIGTRPLILALVDQGEIETAYQVVSQPSEPGWVYMVQRGATALWERWDGDTQIGSGMNSFDHSPWALISEWFFSRLVGVRPQTAGFDRTTVKPHVPDGLDDASADLDTVKGTISVAWAKTASGLTLDVTVPGNVTAEVYMPADDRANVSESGTAPAENAAGVTYLRTEGEYVVYEVGSGSYAFESDKYAAGSATTVDDFEDGDVSEYGGHTGDFVVDGTAPVRSGSNSLKLSTTGSERKIVSTSGLAAYPSAGDTIRTNFQLGSGSDTFTLTFAADSAVADPPNRYDVHINPNTPGLYLFRIQGGTVTQLDSVAVDVSNNVGNWLELEVDWGSSGFISATITDTVNGETVGTVSATDSTFTGGGVGYRCERASSGSFAVDDVRID